MRIFCILSTLSVLIFASSLQAQKTHSDRRNGSTFNTVHNAQDSTKDSLVVDFKNGKFKFRHRRQMHNFLITEPPEGKITRYIEPFTVIDFNRATGFFFPAIGSSRYFDIGRYDEVGIKGGIGYAWTKRKGQSFLGAEYRIPLRSLNADADSVLGKAKFTSVPTLAIGGEYHNLTTTEDQWRIGRLENAFDAFFAREDFRDYFHIEGWEAHLAYRLSTHSEARFEYRNDMYASEDQRVFYGRFGGNKRLPVNPPITEGRFQSYILSFATERARTDFDETITMFGDSVQIETMKGTSYLVQAEFGSNLTNSTTFSKYTVDFRRFQPIITGLNIDSRLRFESTVGENLGSLLLPAQFPRVLWTAPLQKMEFLGGPSTLPAYKNKAFAGNRMLLLNTEVRINLAIISSIFENSGTQILIKNDFGYITSDSTNSPFGGIGKSGGPNVLYNIGVGIGSVSGFEYGLSWRTDISESPRFFFRFERPF